MEDLGKLLLGLETDDGCSSLVQEREEIGRLLLELEREEFGRQSLVLEREDCCLPLVLGKWGGCHCYRQGSRK